MFYPRDGIFLGHLRMWNKSHKLRSIITIFTFHLVFQKTSVDPATFSSVGQCKHLCSFLPHLSAPRLCTYADYSFTSHFVFAQTHPRAKKKNKKTQTIQNQEICCNPLLLKNKLHGTFIYCF